MSQDFSPLRTHRATRDFLPAENASLLGPLSGYLPDINAQSPFADASLVPHPALIDAPQAALAAPVEKQNRKLASGIAGTTLIITQRGEIAAQDLQATDHILTLDNGYKQPRWLGRSQIEPEELQRFPKLQPVQIAAGAMGQGLPLRELAVSPQHRLALRSPLGLRLYNERDTLIAARRLLGLPGLSSCDAPKGITYVHILFDQHELFFANGLACESLNPGPELLKGLTAEQRDSLLARCPDLSHGMEDGPLARLALTELAEKAFLSDHLRQTSAD